MSGQYRLRLEGQGAWAMGTGCPDVASWSAQNTGNESLDCMVTLSSVDGASTLECELGVAGGVAEIAADGTFAFDSNEASLHGRLHAGGVVEMNTANIRSCSTNVNDQKVYQAMKMQDVRGTAVALP
jgi:hypothetical protein